MNTAAQMKEPAEVSPRMGYRMLKNIKLSRLVLGTVQFGLKYGVANRTGQPEVADVKKILEAAVEGGVNCLDTAPNYGSSEEVVGRCLKEMGLQDKIHVLTKILPIPEGLSGREAEKLVVESIRSSLQRLKLNSVSLCSFHRERNLPYLPALLKLKQEGLVRHIGVSITSPKIIRELPSDIEAVQFPASLLDQRFVREVEGCTTVRDSVACFARSVFLQGALLLSEKDTPPHLSGMIGIRKQLYDLAGQAGLSMPELATRYILSKQVISCILTGLESPEQAKLNAQYFSKGALPASFIQTIEKMVPQISDTILDPFRWPGAI